MDTRPGSPVGSTQELVTFWSGGKRAARYELAWSGATFAFKTLETNVYFGGKPLRLGTQTNVVTDRLGSVRREAKDFFPYGQERTVTAGETEKYATYMHDGRTDLAYADQRYYATGAGRFMTADPAGSGLNWYGYVGGDPVNYSDPLGLDRCYESTIRIGGIPGQTVGQLFGFNSSSKTFSLRLASGSDLALLSATMFTESAMRRSTDGTDEMAAIGGVVINRFNIVNEYAQLPSIKNVPIGWGTADGKLSSILNPGNFQIWAGTGGALTSDASGRLATALNADADSNLCAALYNGIGTANNLLDMKGKSELWIDGKTNLAFTGFNSFRSEVKYSFERRSEVKYSFERFIGQYGTTNKFYGVIWGRTYAGLSPSDDLLEIPVSGGGRGGPDSGGRGGEGGGRAQ